MGPVHELAIFRAIENVASLATNLRHVPAVLTLADVGLQSVLTVLIESLRFCSSLHFTIQSRIIEKTARGEQLVDLCGPTYRTTFLIYSAKMFLDLRTFRNVVSSVATSHRHVSLSIFVDVDASS